MKKKLLSLLTAITITTQCMGGIVYAGSLVASETFTFTSVGSHNFTIPSNGYYQIECHGASGATGIGGIQASSNRNYISGNNGSSVKSTICLSKGNVVQIIVGGNGSQGSWSTGDDPYAKGGSGGYPDGGKDNSTSAFNSAGGNRYRWAVGGGGGGSSSVKIESITLVSANGGNGGQGMYTYYDDGDDHHRYASGGSGGGSNYVTTNSLYKASDTSTGTSSYTSGRVIIRRLAPDFPFTEPQDTTVDEFSTASFEITTELMPSKIGSNNLRDSVTWYTSTDNGMTWNKYNNNVYIKNNGNGIKTGFTIEGCLYEQNGQMFKCEFNYIDPEDIASEYQYESKSAKLTVKELPKEKYELFYNNEIPDKIEYDNEEVRRIIYNGNIIKWKPTS